MEVNALYGFVLSLVLIGLIVGVGLLVLDKFMGTSGLSADTVDGINDTIQAIKEIPSTWLGLIVTIVVLAILLTLVIKSFAGGAGGEAR